MIWPHLLKEDNREPLFTFSLPSSFLSSLLFLSSDKSSSSEDESKNWLFGFYMFSLPYWIELISLMVLQMLFASITAIILYKFVLEPKKCNTIQSTIIGWGIILPIWILVVPFQICQLLTIQHLVMRFCIGGIIPTLCIFRTTETIYGYTPYYAKTSLQDFVIYFASVLLFTRQRQQRHHDSNNKKDMKIDSSTGNSAHSSNSTTTLIKCPMSQVFVHFKNFNYYLIILGIFKSFVASYPNLIVFDNQQHHTKTDTHDVDNLDEWWISFGRFGTWELYANNIIVAILFQLYLTTYCEGLSLFWTMMFGYKVDQVMVNPLWTSQSPSQFWGRKWNLVIHEVLKGGIYKPIRGRFTNNNALLAMLGVFVASGLFHEWLVWLIMTPTTSLSSAGVVDDNPSPPKLSTPRYGGSIIFFIWQAIIIGLEMTIGRLPIVQELTNKIPRSIRPICVVALGLPAAHYFVEPYVRSDFFIHGQLGVPMIKRIN